MPETGIAKGDHSAITSLQSCIRVRADNFYSQPCWWIGGYEGLITPNDMTLASGR